MNEEEQACGDPVDRLEHRAIRAVAVFCSRGPQCSAVLPVPAGFLRELPAGDGLGVLFTFFVGIPLCALGGHPRNASAALLPVAAATAVLAAAMASGQPGHLLIVAGLLAPSAVAFLVVAGADLEETRTASRFHWPTLALSVIALPVAAVFAADMAKAAREGRDPIDLTWGFDHWPIQGAAWFGMVSTVPLCTDVKESQKDSLEALRSAP